MTYTGPVCTVTAPNGQQTQVPATVTPDGWISVGAQSYYPGTKFEINGTIRPTLTWTGTGTGPDPQQMILQEDSEATYTSTSGAASNGLGDPCIVSSGGGSSQGSAWNVFTNDGVYTIRRRVSVRGEITASSGFGGVWLRYRVTPTPILPVVQGAVWHDNQFKCLPGHKLILSVNTGTYAQTGHNWTPPGTDLVFKGVNTQPGDTPSFRTYEMLVSPTDTQSHSLVFFVGMPGATAEATLACKIVTPEGLLSAEAKVSYMASDLVLQVRESRTDGKPEMIEALFHYDFWSAVNSPAIRLSGGLRESIPASMFGTPGTWHYSQLIKRNAFRNGQFFDNPLISFDDLRLDNKLNYPYPSAPTQDPDNRPVAFPPTPANNSDRAFEDSPMLRIAKFFLTDCVIFKYVFTADLYVIYTPPSNGVGTSDVAVFRLNWDTQPSYNLEAAEEPSGGARIITPFIKGTYNKNRPTPSEEGFSWSNIFINTP